MESDKNANNNPEIQDENINMKKEDEDISKKFLKETLNIRKLI